MRGKSRWVFLVLFIASCSAAVWPPAGIRSQVPPNNTVFTEPGADTVVSMSINPFTLTAVVPVQGQSTCFVNITFNNMTAVFEQSRDNVTWVPAAVSQVGGGQITSTTGTGFFVGSCAGAGNFRVRGVGSGQILGQLGATQAIASVAGSGGGGGGGGGTVFQGSPPWAVSQNGAPWSFILVAATPIPVTGSFNANVAINGNYPGNATPSPFPTATTGQPLVVDANDQLRVAINLGLSGTPLPIQGSITANTSANYNGASTPTPFPAATTGQTLTVDSVDQLRVVDNLGVGGTPLPVTISTQAPVQINSPIPLPIVCPTPITSCVGALPFAGGATAAPTAAAQGIALVAVNPANGTQDALQEKGQSLAVLPGLNDTGPVAELICDSSKQINVSTSGKSSLVAAVGGKKVYVCAFAFQANGTVTVEFDTGTQTTNPCDTGTTAITGSMSEVANTGVAMSGGVSPLFSTPVGNQLCITLGANVGVTGFISYTQF